MILRVLVTYTALSFLAAVSLMFIDSICGYRWKCERVVAVLVLGPLIVWGLAVITVLAFAWA